MEAPIMNFETYLTGTIQDAVKEAVARVFDDLKQTLMQLDSLQNRTQSGYFGHMVPPISEHIVPLSTSDISS